MFASEVSTADEEPLPPPRLNPRASGARVVAASHISAAQAARALRVHGNTAPVRLPGPGRPRGRRLSRKCQKIRGPEDPWAPFAEGDALF